mmetsp:Transcript_17929/g.58892  ORF Transcript_17929/g.58892 Transcript_17929/m.58892 type:complete len:270 (-) Transcript_17929:1457-2266(-)
MLVVTLSILSIVDDLLYPLLVGRCGDLHLPLRFFLLLLKFLLQRRKLALDLLLPVLRLDCLVVQLCDPHVLTCSDSLPFFFSSSYLLHRLLRQAVKRLLLGSDRTLQLGNFLPKHGELSSLLLPLPSLSEHLLLVEPVLVQQLVDLVLQLLEVLLEGVVEPRQLLVLLPLAVQVVAQQLDLSRQREPDLLLPLLRLQQRELLLPQLLVHLAQLVLRLLIVALEGLKLLAGRHGEVGRVCELVLKMYESLLQAGNLEVRFLQLDALPLVV